MSSSSLACVPESEDELSEAATGAMSQTATQISKKLSVSAQDLRSWSPARDSQSDGSRTQGRQEHRYQRGQLEKAILKKQLHKIHRKGDEDVRPEFVKRSKSSPHTSTTSSGRPVVGEVKTGSTLQNRILAQTLKSLHSTDRDYSSSGGSNQDLQPDGSNIWAAMNWQLSQNRRTSPDGSYSSAFASSQDDIFMAASSSKYSPIKKTVTGQTPLGRGRATQRTPRHAGDMDNNRVGGVEKNKVGTVKTSKPVLTSVTDSKTGDKKSTLSSNLKASNKSSTIPPARQTGAAAGSAVRSSAAVAATGSASPAASSSSKSRQGSNPRRGQPGVVPLSEGSPLRTSGVKSSPQLKKRAIASDISVELFLPPSQAEEILRRDRETREAAHGTPRISRGYDSRVCRGALNEQGVHDDEQLQMEVDERHGERMSPEGSRRSLSDDLTPNLQTSRAARTHAHSSSYFYDLSSGLPTDNMRALLSQKNDLALSQFSDDSLDLDEENALEPSALEPSDWVPTVPKMAENKYNSTGQKSNIPNQSRFPLLKVSDKVPESSGVEPFSSDYDTSGRRGLLRITPIDNAEMFSDDSLVGGGGSRRRRWNPSTSPDVHTNSELELQEIKAGAEILGPGKFSNSESTYLNKQASTLVPQSFQPMSDLTVRADVTTGGTSRSDLHETGAVESQRSPGHSPKTGRRKPKHRRAQWNRPDEDPLWGRLGEHTESDESFTEAGLLRPGARRRKVPSNPEAGGPLSLDFRGRMSPSSEDYPSSIDESKRTDCESGSSSAHKSDEVAAIQLMGHQPNHQSQPQSHQQSQLLHQRIQHHREQQLLSNNSHSAADQKRYLHMGRSHMDRWSNLDAFVSATMSQDETPCDELTGNTENIPPPNTDIIAKSETNSKEVEVTTMRKNRLTSTLGFSETLVYDHAQPGDFLSEGHLGDAGEHLTTGPHGISSSEIHTETLPSDSQSGAADKALFTLQQSQDKHHSTPPYSLSHDDVMELNEDSDLIPATRKRKDKDPNSLTASEIPTKRLTTSDQENEPLESVEDEFGNVEIRSQRPYRVQVSRDSGYYGSNIGILSPEFNSGNIRHSAGSEYLVRVSPNMKTDHISIDKSRFFPPESKDTGDNASGGSEYVVTVFPAEVGNLAMTSDVSNILHNTNAE